MKTGQTMQFTFVLRNVEALSLLDIISKHAINILALQIGTSKIGQELTVLVDNAEKFKGILEQHNVGYWASQAYVLDTDSVPGKMSAILKGTQDWLDNCYGVSYQAKGYLVFTAKEGLFDTFVAKLESVVGVPAAA